MTTYAVIARFDEDASGILCKFKDEMKKLLSFDGTGAWPPHLTLGCYESDNSQDICQWTKEFSQRCSKVQFRFSSLGVFCRGGEHSDTEVIYAVPTMPEALSRFYYGYHEKLDDSCGTLGWQYSMKYGQPELHSTITILKTAEFNLAMDYLRVHFQSFDAAIWAIEVYEVPMKFIARYDVKD